MISTFTIHRTVYPAVRPYSNGNRYAETPILTTSRPIPVRQPTGRGRRRDYNIRGYKDGWVEESGRRQKLITTTTRRPVYSTTYPTYPRTRRPIPTIARLATIVVCHYKSVFFKNIPYQLTKDKTFKIEFVTVNPQRAFKSLGNPVDPRIPKEKF